MFHSIRSKIMVIIVLIVVVSTISTIFFSKSLVQRDKIRGMDDAARNIMHLSMLFIDDEYKDLEMYTNTLTTLRKQFLKDNVSILEGGLASLAGLADDKKISLTEAQARAKRLIRDLRYGHSDYFYAYDMHFVNLAHPDARIQGKDLYDHEDVKGYQYAPDLIAMVNDKGEGFAEVWWERLGEKKPVPKLQYVKLFPEWDWIVGTGVYVDDIRQRGDIGREAMVRTLANTLKKIKMPGKGEVFVFKVGQKMVVPPAFLDGRIEECVNAVSGRPLLDELEKAAEKGVPRLELEVSGPNGYDGTVIFYVDYFRPLSWVVVSFVPKLALLKSVNQLVINQILANLAILLVTLLIAIWVVRRICRPFSHLAEVAQTIARGDIRGAKESVSMAMGGCGPQDVPEDCEKGKPSAEDETGLLYEAFKVMADNLNVLVGKVKTAENTVAGQASAISGTVDRLDEAIVRQAKATGEVAVQATQITALAGELAGTMNSVSSVAHDTAELAEEGLSSLGGIDGSMARLKQATEAISSKLAVINEKAGNIRSVVTTISKVSEKTNLLSLNASIEAEKAGDYGQGFMVVAREIRKLADQTDNATQSITGIVKDMDSAVSAGVMEMDKFGREVEMSAGEIARISDRISSIIGHVSSLEPRVLSVNEGMQSQSRSAESITGAIVELGQSAEETKDLLQDFINASGRLSASIEGLKEVIAEFRVDEKEG